MPTYHHGHLPDALRSATAELIAEKGTSGFSLREVARRAGVSHAAPAHHFGDAEGMLTSLAAEGFSMLADAMAAAVDGIDDATERLKRVGAAYRRTAERHPGHLAVMTQTDLLRVDDSALVEQQGRADATMRRVVTMIRDQRNPNLDIDSATTFCWVAIRGLTPSSDIERNNDLVDVYASFIVDGLAAGPDTAQPDTAQPVSYVEPPSGP